MPNFMVPFDAHAAFQLHSAAPHSMGPWSHGSRMRGKQKAKVIRSAQAAAMTVYSWTDRRNAAAPRAVMQRGECERQQCGQYSISISNGIIGLTIRFESEAEFTTFLAKGQTEPSDERT
jgi:hypothetical protein